MGTYTLTSVGIPEMPGLVSPSQTIEVPAASAALSSATTYQISIPVFWQTAIDAACSALSGISGFHQQYCNLTEGEVDYARAHPRQVVKFLYDGAKAIKLTNQVFPDTDLGGRDSTRANGFQHSVWNALMAISETPNRARNWSTLHEGGTLEDDNNTVVPPANPSNISKMDIHNNRVGFEWVRERSSEPDDREACERMRQKATIAVRWYPSKFSTPNVNPVQPTFIENKAISGVKPWPASAPAAPPACHDGSAMSLGLAARLPSILAVAVCTALAGCSVGGPDCDDFQFDKSAWTSQAQSGGDDRTEAFKDLVSCDVLDGMTRADVKELLGPPLQGSRTPREWTYFLAPGPWDDSHGLVRFSSKGTVTEAFAQDG